MTHTLKHILDQVDTAPLAKRVYWIFKARAEFGMDNGLKFIKPALPSWADLPGEVADLSLWQHSEGWIEGEDRLVLLHPSGIPRKAEITATLGMVVGLDVAVLDCWSWHGADRSVVAIGRPEILGPLIERLRVP